MFSSTASLLIQGKVTLKQGSLGEDVRSLQEFLGFKIEDCDGKFGPKTQSAVVQYQRNHGLEDDGIVGNNTRNMINGVTSSNTSVKQSQGSTTKVANITVAPGANSSVVSAKSLSILGEIASASGNPNVTITSTIRTPAQQASAMYNNLIKPGGVEYNYKLCGDYGDQVIDVFCNSRASGLGKNAIFNAMTIKITTILEDNQYISSHCFSLEKYKQKNTFDVTYKGLSNISLFEYQLEIAKTSGTIYSFLNEQKNECFHIEIKQ